MPGPAAADAPFYVLPRQPPGRRRPGLRIVVLGQQGQNKEQTQLPQGQLPPPQGGWDVGLSHLSPDTLKHRVGLKGRPALQDNGVLLAGRVQPVPHLLEHRHRMGAVAVGQLVQIRAADLVFPGLLVLVIAVLNDKKLILYGARRQLPLPPEGLDVQLRAAEHPLQQFAQRRFPARTAEERGRPVQAQLLMQAPQRHMPRGGQPRPGKALQGLPVPVELLFDRRGLLDLSPLYRLLYLLFQHLRHPLGKMGLLFTAYQPFLPAWLPFRHHGTAPFSPGPANSDIFCHIASSSGEFCLFSV